MDITVHKEKKIDINVSQQSASIDVGRPLNVNISLQPQSLDIKPQKSSGMTFEFVQNVLGGSNVVRCTLDQFHELTHLDKNTWYAVTDEHDELIYLYLGTELIASDGGGLITEITANMVSYNETYPTVEAALDTLLYVAPSISSFSTGLSTQEVGASVSSVTFTWAFNKTMSTISITPDVGTVTGTKHVYTPDAPITSTKTFTLNASDGRNTATRTTTITFSPRIFWLVSDQEVIGPDELLKGSASSALVSSRATTRTFNCSGGKYIYFCIPKSLCSGIKFVVNGLTTTFIMTQMDDFVNSKGANVPMNIYRSMNLLNGSSITVKVE